MTSKFLALGEDVRCQASVMMTGNTNTVCPGCAGHCQEVNGWGALGGTGCSQHPAPVPRPANTGTAFYVHSPGLLPSKRLAQQVRMYSASIQKV